MAVYYMELGPTPGDEDCAQVGNDDYIPRARKECIAFAAQLRRKCGPEPNGARLSIKSFPHDFGDYMEVVCYYDDEIEASVKYALECELAGMGEWDNEAREELGL